MISISVKSEIRSVQERLSKLKDDLQRTAIVSAINRTADQAKTAAVRDITAVFNIRAADARQRILVRRARRAADVIEAELRGSGKRAMNLIRFTTVAGRGRTYKKGQYLKAKVRKDRGLQPVMGRYGQGAFVGNKGRTVFERLGQDRLPIRAVTTVDIPQLMISEIGARNFRNAVRRVFGPNLNREINRLIAGYGLAKGARA